MMILLKNLLYWLCVSLFTVVHFCYIVVCLAFGVKAANRACTQWALALVWLLEHIIGLKYEVKGLENIPDEPVVICCKHQSGWETLILQKFFRPIVFVAKKELFQIPFFGWGLKLAGTIGIDRKDRLGASRQLLEIGGLRKKQGFSIAIFPEGTRIKPGLRGRYKLGGARIANTLEMPIVPVALNSGEFWPKNSFMKYPGTISVVIGKPINPVGQGPEAVMQQVETWIESQQRLIEGRGPFANKEVAAEQDERTGS